MPTSGPSCCSDSSKPFLASSFIPSGHANSTSATSKPPVNQESSFPVGSNTKADFLSSFPPLPTSTGTIGSISACNTHSGMTRVTTSSHVPNDGMKRGAVSTPAADSTILPGGDKHRSTGGRRPSLPSSTQIQHSHHPQSSNGNLSIITTPVNGSTMSTSPQSSSPQSATTPSSSPESKADNKKGNKKASLYKTEFCRSFEETGQCRYGAKCQFAHSTNELRVVDRHPKYKTELCRTFWERGSCPYGKRCCFVHTRGEGQKFPSPGTITSPQPPTQSQQSNVQIAPSPKSPLTPGTETRRSFSLMAEPISEVALSDTVGRAPAINNSTLTSTLSPDASDLNRRSKPFPLLDNSPLYNPFLLENGGSVHFGQSNTTLFESGGHSAPSVMSPFSRRESLPDRLELSSPSFSRPSHQSSTSHLDNVFSFPSANERMRGPSFSSSRKLSLSGESEFYPSSLSSSPATTMISHEHPFMSSSLSSLDHELSNLSLEMENAHLHAGANHHRVPPRRKSFAVDLLSTGSRPPMMRRNSEMTSASTLFPNSSANLYLESTSPSSMAMSPPNIGRLRGSSFLQQSPGFEIWKDAPAPHSGHFRAERSPSFASDYPDSLSIPEVPQQHSAFGAPFYFPQQ